MAAILFHPHSINIGCMQFIMSNQTIYRFLGWHTETKLYHFLGTSVTDKYSITSKIRSSQERSDMHLPGVHLSYLCFQNNDSYRLDGLMQERRNSIVLAMELRLSCTNPSIC